MNPQPDFPFCRSPSSSTVETMASSSRRSKTDIPSEQASSFRKPAERVKELVYSREDNRCWLCENPCKPCLQFAHNIDACISLNKVCFSFVLDLTSRLVTCANDEQLSTWKEGGRLPLSFYPGQVGNLILLCASCHGGYDSRDTTWFMLPADLKFFIKYEENDYNERKAAASQGIKRPRTTPEVLFSLFFVQLSKLPSY